MTPIHTLPRPEVRPDTRFVGKRWSPKHAYHDQRGRDFYRHSAHERTLSWNGPTEAEINGFRTAAVEVGLGLRGQAPCCSARSRTKRMVAGGLQCASAVAGEARAVQRGRR